MPILSIITINLNDTAGLEQTARSVLPALRPGIEWLVVDGGSDDGSCEVIRRHQDSMAYWQSRPDGGVYDAMNQGLHRACGRFVLFLNAGDRLAPDAALDPVLQRLSQADAPDLLFCDAILEFAGGRRIVRPARRADRYLRYGLPALHQATLIRRRVHSRVPYDLGYRITSDYATIARLLADGASWGCLPHRLAVRACSPASLSEREWRRRIQEALRVQREVLGAGLSFRCLSFLRLLTTHLIQVGIRTFCLALRDQHVSTITRFKLFGQPRDVAAENGAPPTLRTRRWAS